MSTLAYAALTTKREQSDPKTSTSTSPPGLKTYVDALAALVPAEVLTLHALIVSVTTKTVDAKTQIIALGTLRWAFFGLIVLNIGIYVVPRLMVGKWDRLDYMRMVIPPLAFIGWTMLQRATAFDAVAPAALPEAARTVIALFLGVILVGAATALAKQADKKKP